MNAAEFKEIIQNKIQAQEKAEAKVTSLILKDTWKDRIMKKKWKQANCVTI